MCALIHPTVALRASLTTIPARLVETTVCATRTLVAQHAGQALTAPRSVTPTVTRLARNMTVGKVADSATEPVATACARDLTRLAVRARLTAVPAPQHVLRAIQRAPVHLVARQATFVTTDAVWLCALATAATTTKHEAAMTKLIHATTTASAALVKCVMPPLLAESVTATTSAAKCCGAPAALYASLAP
jgi:hypothetical protein